MLIELISFEGSAVHLVQLAQSCSVPPLGQAFGKVFGLDSFGDAVDRLTGAYHTSTLVLKLFAWLYEGTHACEFV